MNQIPSWSISFRLVLFVPPFYHVWRNQGLHWQTCTSKLRCWSWSWCYRLYNTFRYWSCKRVRRLWSVSGYRTHSCWHKAQYLLMDLFVGMLSKVLLVKKEVTMTTSAFKIQTMKLVFSREHLMKRTTKKQIVFGP